MTATIHLLNGKPVASAREKPVVPIPQSKVLELYRRKLRSYHKALKEWESECLSIQNAYEIKHAMGGYPEILILKPVYQIVTPGIKAKIQKTEKGKCIIIKILDNEQNT